MTHFRKNIWLAAILAGLSLMAISLERRAARAEDSSAFVSQVEGAARAVGESELRLSKGPGGAEIAPAGRTADPNRNFAVILQQGDGNRSQIFQIGTGNTALVDIRSSDGNSTIQTQRGARNDSRITVVGGGRNAVSTEQQGNDNRGEITLEDSTGLDIRLRQQGDGLSYRSGGLSLSSSGTDGRPIVIEQSGR